jgi:hypothetical protein
LFAKIEIPSTYLTSKCVLFVWRERNRNTNIRAKHKTVHPALVVSATQLKGSGLYPPLELWSGVGLDCEQGVSKIGSSALKLKRFLLTTEIARDKIRIGVVALSRFRGFFHGENCDTSNEMPNT